MLRVALVIDSFSMGGGIINLFRLVERLSDIEFGIFAKSGSCTSFFRELKNVIVFDKGYSPDYIVSFRPDVVHFNHLKPLLAWYCRFRYSPLPVIFTARGLHVHKYEYQNGILPKIYILIFSSAVSDAPVANTNSVSFPVASKVSSASAQIEALTNKASAPVSLEA